MMWDICFDKICFRSSPATQKGSLLRICDYMDGSRGVVITRAISLAMIKDMARKTEDSL